MLDINQRVPFREERFHLQAGLNSYNGLTWAEALCQFAGAVAMEPRNPVQIVNAESGVVVLRFNMTGVVTQPAPVLAPLNPLDVVADYYVYSMDHDGANPDGREKTLGDALMSALKTVSIDSNRYGFSAFVKYQDKKLLTVEREGGRLFAKQLLHESARTLANQLREQGDR